MSFASRRCATWSTSAYPCCHLIAKSLRSPALRTRAPKVTSAVAGRVGVVTIGGATGLGAGGFVTGGGVVTVTGGVLTVTGGGEVRAAAPS